MKHIEALDQLIEAVECGRPDWDAAFLDDSKDGVSLFVLASYRGSLDAAKALHDALLPATEAIISTHGEVSVTGDATCWDTYEGRVSCAFGEEPNVARAWLLATLKAYRAKIGCE